MKRLRLILTAILMPLLCLSQGCGGVPDTQTVPARYDLHILGSIPHNGDTYTQGLLYHEGALYESNGRCGQSTLRKIDASTGRILRERDIPEVFAEGLALFDGRLIQLTYTEGIAFVYDSRDFSPKGRFNYDTEGWGLTTDGKSLIMSDGTDTIAFRNPETFRIERSVRVRLRGKALTELNELEYINGLIYANVWKENFIVQIRPGDGTVVGVIDAGQIARLQPEGSDVLNGIAFDPRSGTLFITGKKWPRIYRVELRPVPAESAQDAQK